MNDKADLRSIPVQQVDRNPENPRLLFRTGELEQLIESIRQYGVQVPISVYQDGRRFVLIDGERRWRACLKLNMSTLPALVQLKPKPLINLLLMFNIHALREQWDLLTIALKLPRVIELLGVELGSRPSERQLSSKTGLSLGLIRRCKLLIDLPDHYKQMILTELKKPKALQRLTEDMFIEMERSLTTVARAMPDVLHEKDSAREALIEKYREGVIPNIVQFRQIAKIARAGNVDADRPAAEEALRKLFAPNNYSIENAYGDSVSSAYTERDLLTRIDGLLAQLNAFPLGSIDEAVRSRLERLLASVSRLLGTRL